MKPYIVETSFIKVLIIKYTNSQDERFSKDNLDAVTSIYSVSTELGEC